jgi:hypothetical protein
MQNFTHHISHAEVGVDISMISGAIQYGEPARSGPSSTEEDCPEPLSVSFIATPKSANFTILIDKKAECAANMSV